MTVSTTIRRGWIATGVILLVAGGAFAQTAPSIDEEEWFIVQLQGQRCGFMRSTIQGVGDTVLTRSYMQIEIARGPAARIKVSMDQHFRETRDGRPLGFTHKMTLGSEPTLMIGTIKDGRVTLVTEQFGQERTATYDFDPDIKLAWGTLLEQRKHGLKPGTAYTIKTYEPSMKVDGPIAVDVKVHGKEAVDVLGGRRRLTRITATMLLAMPIPTDSWVDDDGNMVMTTVNMGMFQLKMLAATKEQAMVGDAEPPELFLNTFVHVSRRIGPDAKRVKLRLRIPKKEHAKLPKIPRTSMQTVRRIGEYEAIVTVGRLDWDAIRSAGASSTAGKGGLKKYLGASTVCDTGDKRIRRLAKKAVKGCKTPAEKADALRRFVTKYVRDKSLDVGFATASEVARTRQGDCSEHAVLLAALARAAGLPARGVSGIVQVPSIIDGDGGAFGYHMWTQVHIGGQWVDIDAAMRETDCNPTHIALTLMPLKDESMFESTVPLLPLLGQLEIEVLSVEE